MYVVVQFGYPKADDPRVAAALVEKYDALVASGQQPHRVTEFFCADVDGSLREDMVQHASGSGMSSRLRLEVMSYQLCKIDDTWAEAAHRDVSSFGKRSTSAKVAITAASQRLQQSLASLDSADHREADYFYTCLRKCKAIGQTLPERALALRPVQKRMRAVQGQVYRCDASGLRSWGDELGSVVSQLQGGQPWRQATIVTRLQKEFLTCAVHDGDLLSIPRVNDEVLGQVGEAALSDRRDILRRVPADECDFYIVVDKAAHRKKQLRTAALSLAHMSLPVSAQRVAWWPAGQAQDPPLQLVYHDGFPAVVDLLSLAPWLVLRSGLQRHTTAPADVPGCMRLCDSSDVDAPGDWLDENTPTLILLERLASEGWGSGQSPREHSLVSCKQFSVRDPVASKAYLRCLLGLPDLLTEDKMLGVLRSDQRAGYYACVLATRGQPGSVLLDQPAKVYASKLALPAPGADLPAALQDDNVASDVGSADTDEVVVVRRLARTARRKPQRSRGVKRKLGANEEWLALTGLAPRKSEEPLPIADGAVGPALDIVQASGAASSSTAAPLQGAPLAAEGVLVAAQAVSAVEDRRWVEGVRIDHEAHGVIGTPGSYRRVKASCPHHAPDGKSKCMISRSFGTRTGQLSGLGDMEPYAFVGAWLQKRAEFADCAEHKLYKPDVEETLAYARGQGWSWG